MKTLVATVVGLVLGLGLPAPSHADTQKVTDATDDVYEQGTMTVDPSNTITDVTSSKVTYAKRLTVEYTVPGMDLSAETSLWLLVKRPDGEKFLITAQRLVGGGIFKNFLKKSDGSATCQGIRVNFDEEATTASVSVPATCLGAPGSLKVGALYSSQLDFSLWLDDIRADGAPEGVMTLGPRLRRF